MRQAWYVGGGSDLMGVEKWNFVHTTPSRIFKFAVLNTSHSCHSMEGDACDILNQKRAFRVTSIVKGVFHPR
jgi:hypothetical protein